MNRLRQLAAFVVVSLLAAECRAQPDNSEALPGQDTSVPAVSARLMARMRQRQASEARMIEELRKQLDGKALPPELGKLARNPEKLQQLLSDPAIRRLVEQMAKNLPAAPPQPSSRPDPATPTPPRDGGPDRAERQPDPAERPERQPPDPPRPESEPRPDPNGKPAVQQPPAPMTARDPVAPPQPNEPARPETPPTPSVPPNTGEARPPEPQPAEPRRSPEPESRPRPNPMPIEVGGPDDGTPPGGWPRISTLTEDQQKTLEEAVRRHVAQLPRDTGEQPRTVDEGNPGTTPESRRAEEPNTRPETPQPVPTQADAPPQSRRDTPEPTREHLGASDATRDAARGFAERLTDSGMLRDPERLSRAFDDALRIMNKPGESGSAGPNLDYTDQLNRLSELWNGRTQSGRADSAKDLFRSFSDLTANRTPNVATPRLPDLPRFSTGGLEALSLPSLGLASGVSGGFFVFLLVVAVVVAGILLSPKLRERLLAAIASVARPGWPVDPRQVRTRDDVIRAFEHLSVDRLGDDAKQSNHRAIAAQLGGPDATTRATADSVAAVYEQARYTPAVEPLDPALIDRARGDLCRLAGKEPA